MKELSLPRGLLVDIRQLSSAIGEAFALLEGRVEAAELYLSAIQEELSHPECRFFVEFEYIGTCLC